MDQRAALTLLTLAGLISGGVSQAHYFGKDLGALTQLHHGVKGRVYAVDSRTLFLKDFHYDGEGPAAYFYVGTSKAPGATGAIRLRDERGGTNPLRRYRGESITLSLPDVKTLKEVKWFSVWCDEYAVNFGDVSIPRDLEYPRPAKVAPLRGVHGVSSDPIVIVDAQTLLVPNFSYDGEAPDAKFWVGRGDKPSPQGIRIPDENGKEAPLRRYDKKTIVLTLPGELTVFDIGHFAVWCEAFTVNFGHISLSQSQLSNVPPSLKMLGVSPQSKLNCEVLHDELAFEVRWAVAGDSIVLQLVSKLDDGEYMSFGISGDPNHSQMVGGDVAVAWVDKATLKGYAVDYYLDAKSQCAGVRGSCPDERLGEKTNSIRLLNAALVNGYSIVTYQRSLKAADELDRAILTNASQPIIWAIGPLNSRNEVSYHHHFTKGDRFIEFGRPPVWNCPMPEGEEEPATEEEPEEPPHREVQRVPVQPTKAVIKPNPVPTPKPVAKVTPWEIPAIQCYEPPDGVFYAQMGPTGGKQGYSAITGHVGWGISWFINGLLIPEINVVRGKKYTFVVEGGSDPEVPARYHPFYITNDPVGGYYHKSDEEKKGVEIYAGVRRTRTGDLNPIGVGRLCNWTPDNSGPEADEYPSFGAYQRSLTLVCEEGNPGVVTWIPDKNTPDTVYYQCFTHRHLGWKINVLDECDITETEESRVVEQIVNPDDLDSVESIQVHSRINPDGKFLDERKKVAKIINTKTNYDNFSSYKDGELTGEVYRTEDRNQLFQNKEFELPISNVQLREVIETVENLESKVRAEMKRNATNFKEGLQYQVHEDVKDFLPETPIREDDEYFVDPGKHPENYLLPPNQKPSTLQSVMRPGHNKPSVHKRPYRRPAPPEIKLRRPPPPNIYQKGNLGYPLPMPNAHLPYGMKKGQQKFPNNRQPINRPQGHPPSKSPIPSPSFPSSAIPPMKSMPPLQNFHHQKPGFTQVQKQGPKNNPGPPPKAPLTIVMAKPVNIPTTQTYPSLQSQGQTMNSGNTDIIVNHVVKSQIKLPSAGDAVAQHSIPQTFLKPNSEQIILGKPIDTPLPFDQQMLYTKPQITRTPPTPPPIYFQSSTAHNLIEQQEQTDMKSSDFIGESLDEPTFTPAVNTGFKPDSIVVESGFKPIIREPLMAAEDRIADYESDSNINSNRRQDTDVEEDYDESPQHIANHELPSEKLTETFEPMFIPSPPDHLLPTNDRTKEIFPANHAKEDRPHPVYVKTESELNALFSKKNMERDIPSDMVMASDRLSPHYLPPDPKVSKEYLQKLNNEQTFTSYDGKTISAATLTSVPDIMMKSINKFSSKLPASPELLLKMPQFGPFKGEIPPPVAEHIGKDAQKSSKDSVLLPLIKTTRLKLVSVHKSDEPDLDDLKADGSENIEVTAATEEAEDDDDEYDYEEEEKSRRKRESKTTQFERGEVIEQKQSNKDSSTKNQIEFEAAPGSVSKTRLSWTAVVLLLCTKLF